MSDSGTTTVTYDNNLIRQTCGKLYLVDEKGALQPTGSWCFQFSGKNPNILDVVVSLSGSSSMAAAMGTPMTSTGELSKDSVQELKSWLTDILQKMGQNEIKNSNVSDPI